MDARAERLSQAKVPLFAAVFFLVATAAALAGALGEKGPIVARWSAPLAVLLGVGGLVYALVGGTGAVRIGNAMVKRNSLTLVSYRFQLVSIAVYAIVSLLLLYFIGKPLLTLVFGPVAGMSIPGLPPTFLLFLVLGVAVWPVFWKSWEVTAMSVRREQWGGTFESIVPTPDGVRALPFAYLWSSLGFTLLAQVIVLVVMMVALPEAALRLREPAVALNFAAVVLVTILMMWGMGLLFGGLAILYKQIGPIDAVVKLIFIALAGVFIPVSALPAWMQTVAKLLPLTYSLELLHGVAIDGNAVTDAPWALGFLLAFAVVFIVAGTVLYNVYVEKARRHGAMQGY